MLFLLLTTQHTALISFRQRVNAYVRFIGVPRPEVLSLYFQTNGCQREDRINAATTIMAPTAAKYALTSIVLFVIAIYA